MKNGKIYGSLTDNGLILNGKYLNCSIILELVDIIAQRVFEKQTALIQQAVAENEAKTKFKDANYTVKEVAKMLNKAIPTITMHIRLGMLKATKAGGSKAWIISEENYYNYKNNIHK
jgi:hypothetical protein